MILSVSNRSKFSEPPGKCLSEARRARALRSNSYSEIFELDAVAFPFDDPECPLVSRTRGVSAPLTRLTGLVLRMSSFEDWDDEGVDSPLGTLLPAVAAIDGDEGGSGDRVK